MSKNSYKLVSPLNLWILLLVGWVAAWQVIPDGEVFKPGSWGAGLVVLGLINWIYISIFAYRVHPNAGRGTSSIDRVITEGVYAVVRHPMYVADIILAWAVFIWTPTYQVLAFVVWLTLVLLFWANAEERMLEEKFMDEYRSYKQRVPMLVPRLKKK